MSRSRLAPLAVSVLCLAVAVSPAVSVHADDTAASTPAGTTPATAPQFAGVNAPHAAAAVPMAELGDESVVIWSDNPQARFDKPFLVRGEHWNAGAVTFTVEGVTVGTATAAADGRFTTNLTAGPEFTVGYNTVTATQGAQTAEMDVYVEAPAITVPAETSFGAVLRFEVGGFPHSVDLEVTNSTTGRSIDVDASTDADGLAVFQVPVENGVFRNGTNRIRVQAVGREDVASVITVTVEGQVAGPEVVSASGAWGVAETVTATGFGPGETVVVTSAGGEVLASTSAGDDGTVTADITATPGMFTLGDNTIFFNDTAGEFHVNSPTLSMVDGHYGETVTMTGAGWLPGDLVALEGPEGVVVDGITVAADGTFSASFRVTSNMFTPGTTLLRVVTDTPGVVGDGFRGYVTVAQLTLDFFSESGVEGAWPGERFTVDVNGWARNTSGTVTLEWSPNGTGDWETVQSAQFESDNGGHWAAALVMGFQGDGYVRARAGNWAGPVWQSAAGSLAVSASGSQVTVTGTNFRPGQEVLLESDQGRSWIVLVDGAGAFTHTVDASLFTPGKVVFSASRATKSEAVVQVAAQPTPTTPAPSTPAPKPSTTKPAPPTSAPTKPGTGGGSTAAPTRPVVVPTTPPVVAPVVPSPTAPVVRPSQAPVLDDDSTPSVVVTTPARRPGSSVNNPGAVILDDRVGNPRVPGVQNPGTSPSDPSVVDSDGDGIPDIEPTPEPTEDATVEPTEAVTDEPTPEPTVEPTPEPTEDTVTEPAVPDTDDTDDAAADGGGGGPLWWLAGAVGALLAGAGGYAFVGRRKAAELAAAKAAVDAAPVMPAGAASAATAMSAATAATPASAASATSATSAASATELDPSQVGDDLFD